ncbi:hypothetical protein [Thermomonospora amylolytica]|uniref:hypothetical protein n=1 Tax=Thermomonospora amylolytica TaxID=1411117 RepID=UPI000E6D22EC|nr:hypothetical protein [Thermomonospora amylolytica]
MNWAEGVAFASSGVYFTGIAFFKAAADRMGTLHGTRPLRMIAEMLASPVWAAGAVIMAVGPALQIVALSLLPLPAAQPVFMSALVVLVAIGLGCFAERLDGRECGCLLLVALGTVLVAAAAAGTGGDAVPPATPFLLLMTLPCLAGPVAVFVLRDLRPAGGHARPSTGVTLGVTAGALIGTAELALTGMTRLDPSTLAATPYPYLFLVAVGLGIGQLQAALQRHRMVIVVFAATAVAKTHLLLTGTILYRLSWPDGPGAALLPLGAVLIAMAVVTLPRHERPEPAISPAGRS